MVVGEILGSSPARLAGRVHRDVWRPRLQYARHARQPPRHAELPIRRDRPRQRPTGAAGHSSSRRAEIETAIVFSLPTVGPAIVGSLSVGDVWVTATFMLVLATTLIVGNIIADILLVLLDPRVRLGGGKSE